MCCTHESHVVIIFITATGGQGENNEKMVKNSENGEIL